MRKRRTVASLAFTGAAAAAAAGLHVTPAAATNGTWIVKPHGHWTGPVTGSLRAGTEAGPCSGSAGGSFVSKATGAPAHLGTISQLDVMCHLGLLPFSFKLNKAAQFYGSTYNATSGTTRGKIKSFSGTLTGKSGFACTAVLKGTEPWSFDNTTHLLVIDKAKRSSLSITRVTGCAGQLRVGQKVFFKATIQTGVRSITDP